MKRKPSAGRSLTVKGKQSSNGSMPQAVTIREPKEDFDSFLSKVVKSIASYQTTDDKPNMGNSDLSLALGRPGLLSYETMRRIYERSSLIRMVVDTKVKAIVSLDYDVVADNADEETPAEFVKAAKDFIDNPNADDTYYSIMTKMLVDLFILDALAAEKVRGDGGAIVEVLPVDASTIVPMVDKHGRIGGYKQVVLSLAEPYGLNRGQNKTVKTSIDFSKQDFAYLHEYPSNDRIWGRSPLEVLIVEIATDLYAMGYNANYFTDGFLFSKILVLPRLGDGEVEKIQAKFDSSKGKPKEMPIVETADPEKAVLLDTGFKSKDMEFNQLEEWIFKRICGVYQISPNEIIELYQSATRASAEVQKQIAETKGLKPIIKLLEMFWTKIIQEKFHPNLRFDIVPERTSERERAETLTAQVNAGIPLNHALKEMGHEPVDFKLSLNGITFNPYDYPDDLLGKIKIATDITNPARQQAVGFGSGNGEDQQGSTEGKELVKALLKLRPQADVKKKARVTYYDCDCGHTTGKHTTRESSGH